MVIRHKRELFNAPIVLRATFGSWSNGSFFLKLKFKGCRLNAYKQLKGDLGFMVAQRKPNLTYIQLLFVGKRGYEVYLYAN